MHVLALLHVLTSSGEVQSYYPSKIILAKYHDTFQQLHVNLAAVSTTIDPPIPAFS